MSLETLGRQGWQQLDDCAEAGTVTPEVIRKHYEKLEAMTIAKRAVERRISANHQSPTIVAPAARGGERALTSHWTCRNMVLYRHLRRVSEWLAATLEMWCPERGCGFESRALRSVATCGNDASGLTY